MPNKHHFKFAARVLEHLGAELISSDDVALYELAKNGFDATPKGASSAVVTVEVEYHVDVALVLALQECLLAQVNKTEKQLSHEEVSRLFQEFADSQQDSSTAHAIATVEPLLPSRGFVSDFIRAIGSANSITVSDGGIGMSDAEVVDYFLTIGTRHRHLQHKQHIEAGEDYPGGFVPAGEKGIGRLSMMRLGKDAFIRTWQERGNAETLLAIDWRRFCADTDVPAQDIEVDLTTAPKGPHPSPSGTIIRITDLNSSWDLEKTESVGHRFLSKFLDPFRGDRSRQVRLFWNGTPVTIPQVGRSFLDAALNGMKGVVSVKRNGPFRVSVDYWFTTEAGIRREFNRTYTTLDFGELKDEDVALVGPFEFELYHYNRRRLGAIPGVATRPEFREWLDEWSGGLKLYRDGVRVMPYGEIAPSKKMAAGGGRDIAKTMDDWLELDANALRGKSYRVNRIQVVGCVRISRTANPELRDQANREGLVDNRSARLFIALLKELVRHFVTELGSATESQAEDLEELHEHTLRAQEDFEGALEDLIAAAIQGDGRSLLSARKRVETSLAEVKLVLDETQKALEENQFNRIDVFELAATGIAAESIAHDLEATLDHTLEQTTAAAKISGRTSPLGASLNHLQSVLKSLRVQISQIKPGPARHRRRRSTFDLWSVIDQASTYYEERFRRHGIQFRTSGTRDREFAVYAVEGHVRQVLDNLFRNSIYWLKATREKHPSSEWRPEIRITLDRRSTTLSFTDSGVGVALEDTEWVFGRFHSRKPRGRGLGLYISKELCDFNKIGIAVDTGTKNPWRRYNTFVLDFSGCPEEGRKE